MASFVMDLDYLCLGLSLWDSTLCNMEYISSWQAANAPVWPVIVKVTADVECVVKENIYTSPTEGFMVWTPHPQFQFCFILSFKNCCFWDPPPFLLEFPMTRLGVDMNIFWNYTINFFYATCLFC